MKNILAACCLLVISTHTASAQNISNIQPYYQSCIEQNEASCSPYVAGLIEGFTHYSFATTIYNKDTKGNSVYKPYNICLPEGISYKYIREKLEKTILEQKNSDDIIWTSNSLISAMLLVQLIEDYRCK